MALSRKFLFRSIAAAALVAAAGAWWLTREPARRNVLTASGGPEVQVMDFSRPFSLDPLPDGWRHRTFWTRAPDDFAFAVKAGVPALRVATHDSASMLFRHVDIDLDEYPILAWRWYVEKGIDSPIDERTRAGDDHPARLFLTVRDAAGEKHSFEIIWGNRLLKAGDNMVIDGFRHYVADGGAANIGRWRDERVDLAALVRLYWGLEGPVRLLDVAVFCDSDETGGETVSYVADVRLVRAASR